MGSVGGDDRLQWPAPPPIERPKPARDADWWIDFGRWKQLDPATRERRGRVGRAVIVGLLPTHVANVIRLFGASTGLVLSLMLLGVVTATVAAVVVAWGERAKAPPADRGRF